MGRRRARPVRCARPAGFWKPVGFVVGSCALLMALAGCAALPPKAEPAAEPGATHSFRATRGPAIASPLVADLDGDSALEIAWGAWDGYFYVTDTALNDKPGWPKFSPGGFFSSPAAGDLDGDGSLEVVVGSEAGKLFAWRADGTDLPGWPVDLRHRIWSGPTLLPGGRVAVLGAGQMFLLDARGRPVKGWPQAALGWGDSTAAFDGEVLTVATLAEGAPPAFLAAFGIRDAGVIHAWRLDGTPLPGFPVRLAADADSSPVLVDLDGDGRNEIVVGDDAGLVHALDLDGQPLLGFPQQTDSLVEASAAAGDLDGDGAPDVVIGSWDGRMYAWNGRGEQLPGWPAAAGDQLISSAALVDLDGDGLPDVVAGSKDRKLHAWNGRGETISGFPVDLGAFVFSSPWVGDLNADGRADIVVGANNGLHVLRNVAPLGKVVWSKFRYDNANTGYAGGR